MFALGRLRSPERADVEPCRVTPPRTPFACIDHLDPHDAMSTDTNDTPLPVLTDFIAGPVDPEREGRELAALAMEYVGLEMLRTQAIDDIEAEVQRARRDPAYAPRMDFVDQRFRDLADFVCAQENHRLVPLRSLVQVSATDTRFEGVLPTALRTLAGLKAQTRDLLLEETASKSASPKTVGQLERRYDLVEQSEWALRSCRDQYQA